MYLGKRPLLLSYGVKYTMYMLVDFRYAHGQASNTWYGGV